MIKYYLKVLLPVFIISYFTEGNKRSINAKKNIALSFIIKGMSIATGLIMVPMMLHYINPTRYGIWLTLTSITAWFSFFDVGFGHGLRNKFAEAIANGKHKLARIYVSTTYAILSIIAIVLLILFFCINPFLNWTTILNTENGMAKELHIIAILAFGFFCIQFVLQLINVILYADQQPAKVSLFNFIGSLILLIIIYVLTKTTSGNLIYLAITLGFTPVLVLIISSFWFYTHLYRKYSPNIKYVKFRIAPNLLSLGAKFFIIQIGVLILLQTDNIVIIQLFGSKEVTTYNIAFKLFSLVILVFSIIMAPLWSAFTEAYAKKDFKWISHLFYKMQKVCFILLLLTVVLLSVSPFLFNLWVGDKVQIPFSLSIAMAMYAISNSWLLIPCFLLNGIGKIKLQLYLYLVCIFLNIPIAIFLGKIYGLPGIAIANVIIFVSMSLVLTVQCKKIINNTAQGIWAE